MLQRIIELSLRHRLVVLLVASSLVLWGALAVRELPFDAFPDTTPVQVQVNTIAPALGAEEVEQQITLPVELGIAGMPGLEEVRSISKFGLSQVTATFEDDVDIYFARQLLEQRLHDVELLEGLPRPKLGPVSTGLGEIYHYILRREAPPGMSAEENLRELRTIQDWVVKRELRSVPGVAEVNGWGGFEKQYEVAVDFRRLANHGLALGDLLEALRRNNLNVGGGIVSRAGEAQVVKGIGIVTSVEEIGSIVIRT